jgi:hypothetical protein
MNLELVQVVNVVAPMVVVVRAKAIVNQTLGMWTPQQALQLFVRQIIVITRAPSTQQQIQRHM